MKNHDTESKTPEPNALATKLFYFTLAAIIAYAVVVYVYIEVIKP
jgi:hypothetical protein